MIRIPMSSQARDGSSHDEAVESCTSRFISVDRGKRHTPLRELALCGVNEQYLFPDIDGLGRSYQPGLQLEFDDDSTDEQSLARPSAV